MSDILKFPTAKYKSGDFVAIPGDGKTLYPSFYKVRNVNLKGYRVSCVVVDVTDSGFKPVASFDETVDFKWLDDFGQKLKDCPEFDILYGS